MNKLWTSMYTNMYVMYHLHTCLYNVCTVYILVWTWFIPVHPVSYHGPAISSYVRSISLMNAIRTRLNTLCNRYRQCNGTGICLSVYTVYIPPKNGSGRWFPVAFSEKRVRQRLNMVQQCMNSVYWCLYMKIWKCHRKADHLPEQFLRGIYTAWKCMYRWANSWTIALLITIRKDVLLITIRKDV